MGEDQVLEIVSFSAAGHRFAVEAAQISGMLDREPDAALTVESLMGLPSVKNGQRYWLRVAGRCVEVGGSVDLRIVPAATIYSLPELVAARLQIKGIRALAQEPGGAILLVDLRSLLM
jgi:hypothetical protein